MGPDDIEQWARDFYPVYDRQGLIIDVRHNGGGNIDSWILAKLLRKAWFYWQPRVGNPCLEHAVRLSRPHRCSLRPGNGFRWRSVHRRDPPAGSGQDHRRADLGRRDMAFLLAMCWRTRELLPPPRMGVYGPEGKWLIEGHGVDPGYRGGRSAPCHIRRQRRATGRCHQIICDEEIRKDPRPVPQASALSQQSLQVRKVAKVWSGRRSAAPHVRTLQCT